jgi:hypothetical protein
MSWNLSPLALLEAGATGSLWRITKVVLAALIAAIVPPITIGMLQRGSPTLHKRLANPRRKRKTAVNYPGARLS